MKRLTEIMKEDDGGFTLVEVLAVSTIFLIGLAGFMSAESTSMMLERKAYEQDMAAKLVCDMIEQLKITPMTDIMQRAKAEEGSESDLPYFVATVEDMPELNSGEPANCMVEINEVIPGKEVEVTLTMRWGEETGGTSMLSIQTKIAQY